MANSIKESAGGLALQVTKSARDAGLVEENDDGEATRLADVWVYGFDDLLLVIDEDRVSRGDRAELVSAAAGDTDSIYGGERAGLSIAGNGYQVQLPKSSLAGFHRGDKAPVSAAEGVLAIRRPGSERLADDILTIRQQQVNNHLAE